MTGPGLRQIIVQGPEAKGGPIFKLDCDVVYDDHETANAVDRMPALRAMGLNPPPGNEVAIGSDKKRLDFLAPSLMRARLDKGTERKPDLSAPLNQGAGKGQVNYAFGQVTDVVLVPQESWPIETHATEILVPIFGLVAGAIAVRLIAPDGHPSEFADFLNYNKAKNTVFGGWPLLEPAVDAAEKGPLVHLVPDGVELDVEMPNPVPPMGGDGPPTLPVRLRLEPDGTHGFRARVIGPPNPQAETELTQNVAALRAVFDALQRQNAPVSVQFNDGLQNPPYLWNFEEQNGRLSATHGAEDWRFKMEAQHVIIRMETGIGPNSMQPAIARLNLHEEEPNFALANGTVTMESSAGGAVSSPITANYSPKEAAGGATPPETVQPQPIGLDHLEVTEQQVYLPLFEAARRQRSKAAPADSDTGSPSDSARQNDAFLMLEDGTLQIAARPGPLKPRPERPPSSAFDGGLAFSFENATLEIDRATAAGIKVIWTEGAVAQVTLVLGGVSGGLRNAVWVAVEDPTPDRLLPTGQTDPAASREVIAVMGGAREANFTLAIPGISTSGLEWSLKAALGDTSPAGTLVFWSRPSALPLVSAMPMLALDEGRSGPSEIRNLVPRAVDPETPWRLQSTSADGLPRLAQKTLIAAELFQWPWAQKIAGDGLDWGKLSVPMVNPLAPGVEYSYDPVSADVSLASLRYDLPILDEFFAGLSAEDLASPAASDDAADATQIDGAVTPPFDGRVQGVLSPENLHRHWTEQTLKLGLSRTQMARATSWTSLEAQGVPGPGNLIRGMMAEARVAFPSAYFLADFNASLTLGAYAITWEGSAEKAYYGEDALAGLSGDFDIDNNRIQLTDKAGDLRIEGFATALYSDGAGYLHDGNRTGLLPELEATGENAVARGARTTGNGTTTSTQDVRLYTLAAPEKLPDDLLFWARDLPLKAGVFWVSENPLEAQIGPTTAAFEPGNAAEALYEWRFGKKTGLAERPAYWFQKGLLRYWPIRLLYFRPGQHLKILCRTELARPEETAEPGQSRFQSDRPYGIGQLVEWSYDLADGGGATATVRQLDTSKPTLEFTGENPRLQFAFDARLYTHLAEAIHPNGPEETEQTDDRAMVLSGRLSATGALEDVKLGFSMLGRDLTVDLVEDSQDTQDNALFRLKPDQRVLPRFGFRLENVALNSSFNRLDAYLVGGIPVDTAGSTRPMVIRATREASIYRSYFLGLDGVNFDKMVVDHDRGTLQLETTAPKRVQGDPIAGIPVRDGRISMAMMLVLNPPRPDPNNPAEWQVDSGHVTVQLTATDTHNGKDMQLALDCATAIEYAEPDYDRPKVSSDIRLDWGWSEPLNSGVAWDPDAIKAIDEDPNNLANPLSTLLEIEGSASDDILEHRVHTSLNRHPLTSGLLALVPSADSEAPEAVQLEREIPVTLLVSHGLAKRGAPEDTVLSWTALEPAVLTQGRLWTEGYDPDAKGEDARVFGPRYIHTANVYRGQAQTGISIPGIGTRREMLGGFDDRAIWDNPPGMGRHDPVVLIGGGPGLVQMEAGHTVFGLPWVVPFVVPDLPEALSELMEFDRTRHQWRAARFDASPTAIAHALPDAVRRLPPEVRRAREIEEFLTKGLTEDNNNEFLTMARLVEQTFVETADLSQEIPEKSTPIFLHALVALRAVLRQVAARPGDPFSVLTVHPVRRIDRVHRSDTFAGLTIVETADDVPTSSPAAAKDAVTFELRAMRRGDLAEQRRLELPQGAAAAPGKTPDIQDVAEGYGVVLLRSMAENLIERPDAAAIHELDGDKHTRALHSIRLLPEHSEFGTDSGPLTVPEQEVYVSPALGWPEFPWAADAVKADAQIARLGLGGRQDVPVQSAEAGLSARSASFFLNAPAASPENAQDARYVATQARALFEHGSSAEETHFPGAPALHLQLMSPRARTPLWEAREHALREAGANKDAQNPLAETLGLLPLGFSRSLIGERPGAFETIIDGVLQDGLGNRPDHPDEDQNTGVLGTGLHEFDPSFGRAASIAPVIMRQLRIPRSPALPVGQFDGVNGDEALDPNVRRRTYVSLGDRSGATAGSGQRPDPLANHLVRPMPASFWRGETSGDPFRIVLELLTETLDTSMIEADVAIGRGLRLKLSARVLVQDGQAPSKEKAVAALQASGILPARDVGLGKVDSLDAWVSIGSRRFDAANLLLGHDMPALGGTVAIDSPPEALGEAEGQDWVMPLTLEFAGSYAQFLIEELIAPDPNERAALHVSMRQSPDDPVMLDPKKHGRFEIQRGSSDGEEANPQDPDDITKISALQGGLPREVALRLNRKPSRRLARRVKTTAYLFADPAFDRALATPAGQSNIVKQSVAFTNAEGIADAKELEWLLAVDRVQYDTAGTMFLAFGRLDEATGGMVQSTNAFPQEISQSVTFRETAELRFRATFPGASDSVELVMGETAIPTKYLIQEATAYAIPLSSLTTVSRANVESAVPAGLKVPAGSKIEVEVSCLYDVGTTPTGTLIYVFTLAEEVKTPSPSAVYSTLRLEGSFDDGAAPGASATVPENGNIVLHKTAPKPTRTDFPDLVNDLARGSVRRQAVFEWPLRTAGAVATETQSFIVKTDRSGGAQLPVYTTDFQTLIRR